MQKQLVLALDVLEKDKMCKILQEVKNSIDFVKINYPVVLKFGIDIVNEVSKIKPVIADFKIADIPEISVEIAKIAFESGAVGVIVHGIVGQKTLADLVNVSNDYNGEIYVLVDLTQTDIRFPSYKIAKIAKKLKCHGVVVPGTKPWKIRKIKEIVGDLKILSPGIGFQGGEVINALKAGADYIIVGRSIYLSDNPKKVAENFKETIRRFEKFDANF